MLIIAMLFSPIGIVWQALSRAPYFSLLSSILLLLTTLFFAFFELLLIYFAAANEIRIIVYGLINMVTYYLFRRLIGNDVGRWKFTWVTPFFVYAGIIVLKLIYDFVVLRLMLD